MVNLQNLMNDKRRTFKLLKPYIGWREITEPTKFDETEKEFDCWVVVGWITG
jgi:hypothetical protein